MVDGQFCKLYETDRGQLLVMLAADKDGVPEIPFLRAARRSRRVFVRGKI